MKYIIDRATKEHERYDGQNYDATKYHIVQADYEGWIKHTGTECPLPDDAPYETKARNGFISVNMDRPQTNRWSHNGSNHDTVAYRPIREQSCALRQENEMKTTDEISAMYGELAGKLPEKKLAVKFMHRANKNHCMIAGEMAEKIKDVILAYEDKIPLALAVGVLDIVKKEIIESNFEV